MKIEELKRKIESGNHDSYSIIFINKDNCEFLIHQYIHAIVSNNDYIAVVVEGISDIPTKIGNSLIPFQRDYFYIYYTDVEEDLRKIPYLDNCCIIYTGKKLKDFLDIEDYIVDIPKVEKWQIYDYVRTRAGDIGDKNINYLIDISKNNLFKLEKEIDKIILFDEQYRKEIVERFIIDGIFDDSDTLTVFDLTDAVVKRKQEEAYHIYNKLINQDLNAFSIINLLYSNFRNIIKIQLSPNPSPENTGLKANQFWAVKKNNIGFYHKQELLSIFELLTSMDRKIKTGEIPADKSVEYLLLNIFKL